MKSDQRQQLDEFGYVAVPSFMSFELLETLRNRVDELFEKKGECGI